MNVRPKREPARNNRQTYFITFQTSDRKPLFRNERWCALLLEVMTTYRDEFELHDFVFMQDHIHLLITPGCPLERAVQLIKGGFSYRAKRDLLWSGEIWQAGFSDHRIRDASDVAEHLLYIHRNVGSTSSECAKRYNGETDLFSMDPLPQWLKPPEAAEDDGGAKAPPLQSEMVTLRQSDLRDSAFAQRNPNE